jgi:hypothetical protein
MARLYRRVEGFGLQSKEGGGVTPIIAKRSDANCSITVAARWGEYDDHSESWQMELCMGQQAFFVISRGQNFHEFRQGLLPFL